MSALSSVSRTLSGEIAHFQQEEGRCVADLFFAGVRLYDKIPVVCMGPCSVTLLHSSDLRFDRVSRVLQVLPKGRLLGGAPFMRHLGAFENAVNAGENALKIADALERNGMNPNQISNSSLARRYLQIVISVLDPTSLFEGFSEDLAQAAEDEVFVFVNRLARARAPMEAWLNKHQAAQRKTQLRGDIARLRAQIQESQAKLSQTESQIRVLNQQNQPRREAISTTENKLRRYEFTDLENKRSGQISEKTKLEGGVRKCDELMRNHPNTQVARDAREAKYKLQKSLILVNELIRCINENIVIRGESIREINRLKLKVQQTQKEIDQLVRQMNHLRQEISRLNTEIGEKENQLSDTTARL